MATQDPRARFFNEAGDMLPPFVEPTWRGCVLDPDSVDYLRMPPVLFDALLAAAAPPELQLARYTPDHAPDVIAADGDAFRAYMLDREHWSLEWVLFDASGQWAVLADADATVVGAAPYLADRIDRILSEQGTSLVQLTDADFPDLDPVDQPGARYVLAVTGRQERTS